MKTTILLILISLNLSAQLDQSTKHVYAGCAITIFTSEVLQGFKVKPWKAVLIGFGTGVLSGVVKELIIDKPKYGSQKANGEFADICWGSLIGVAIEIPIIDLKARHRDKKLLNITQ